jgi:hypothetical protein
MRIRYLSVVALALGTIAVPMSLALGSRSAIAGSRCGERGWAATATGKPVADSSAHDSSFLVWHDSRGWHVHVTASSASSALAGQVDADAHLRIVAVGSSLRSGLQAGPRALSFHIAAGVLGSLDFTASCATRLRFRLGTASATKSPLSPIPVYLGWRGRAPATSFQLTRPAVTGVAGRIIVGPTCPAIGPGSNCPPAKAGHGTVRIETAASSRDGSGQLVKRVQSDAGGNFRANLSPGRYLLVVESSGTGYPVPKPSVVDVEAGVVTQVILVLDTGIR